MTYLIISISCIVIVAFLVYILSCIAILVKKNRKLKDDIVYLTFDYGIPKYIDAIELILWLRSKRSFNTPGSDFSNGRDDMIDRTIMHIISTSHEDEAKKQ